MAAVAVAASTVLAACRIVASPERHDLNVDNGTTLSVAVAVNETVVATIAPGESERIASDNLPALPWSVDAKTPTGRVLLHLDVPVGSVWSKTNPDGSTEHHGAANRVDLSCGRLDLYVGPPLAGPMPGPGVPGDCDP